MKKQVFTIKIVAGMLLFVGTSITMKAQTKKTFVTMFGEKVEFAPLDLATPAETITGTDATKAVHPAGLKTALDTKADLNAPTFTGIPKADTPASSPTSKELANVEFVLNAVSAATGGTVIVDATETAKGIVELATAAETTTGAINTKAVHPAGLKVELDKKATVAAVNLKADQTAVDAALLLKADASALAAKADIASPVFTGTPSIAVSLNPADDSKNLATTEFVKANIASVSVPDGTESTKGKLQLATAGETTTGTIDTKAVHPAGLKVELDKKATVVAVNLKADQTAVDAALLLKADASSLAAKANIASPDFTGTPTAPNATQGVSSAQLANTKFVIDAIAAIPAGAGVADATETVEGIVEFADATEISQTTRKDRAVHPEGLHAVVDAKLVAKANIASPVFTGTPSITVSLAANDDSKNLATTEFVNDAMAVAGAVVKQKSQEFPTGNAGRTIFPLTIAPSDLNSVKFIINGVRIVNAARIVSGSTVEYIPGSNGSFNLTANDVVVIDYN